MADFTRKALALAKRAVQEELRALHQRFVQRMTTERLSGPTSQHSLAVRTGQLRRSLGVRLVDSGFRLGAVAFIGGGVPYALIHEKGGTILPRRAKLLAIPVGAAKTRAGVHRFGTGPRQAGDLTLIKNRRTGNLLLVRATRVESNKLIPTKHGASKLVPKLFKRGKRYTGPVVFSSPAGQFRRTLTTRLDVLYVLKPSVTIPPRMGFGATFEQEAKTTLSKIAARIANLGKV